MCAAHGNLSESHFDHIMCFYANFPCFLTNLIAHSLFRFLDHSECDEDTPVSIWDHMRLRETTARVPSATRPRARSEGDASLGALSYRRTNSNPYAF
jgi:hypothetical protein